MVPRERLFRPSLVFTLHAIVVPPMFGSVPYATRRTLKKRNLNPPCMPTVYKELATAWALIFIGVTNRSRTGTFRNHNPKLYRLSYGYHNKDYFLRDEKSRKFLGLRLENAVSLSCSYSSYPEAFASK